MRSLDEATRRLAREVPTRRDLWPALERRARRRDRNRALARWGGAVAGVLILAAVPAGLLWRQGSAPEGPLGRAEREYGRARAALLEALESQARHIEPEALELVRRDLETVDRDLTALRTAAMASDDSEARLITVAARYERDTRILTETTRLLARPAVLWKE